MKAQMFFNQGKRFFLNGRDKVAEYVRRQYADESAAVIAAADDIVAQKFLFNMHWDMEQTEVPVIFENEIDWLHQPGDDPEWIYAFNRMHFWLNLGRAYALTKDEKYAQAFASQLCSWVAAVKKDEPKNAKAWRTIEAGIRMEYWTKSICYFEGSPALTNDVMDTFLSSMAEHAEYILSIYNTYNLMSNWGVLANHGLFIVGVMLPDSPRTAQYRAEAIRRLDQEIRIQVYPDGTQWEQSPMYHNEVTHDFLDVVLLAGRNHIDLPESIVNKTRDMCYVDLYAAKPDGNELSMGDSDEIDLRDILTKGAYLYEDGVLKSGGCPQVDFETAWEFGFSAVESYEKLRPVTPPETASAFPNSGNFYFRSDWDKNAAFLHFHCGTLGAGHGHSDQLHFDLFSRGEDIFIDAGRYTYVDKPERYEFKDSTAHNTCTVDDANFYVCKDSWACSKLNRAVNQKFVGGEKYGYVEGGHLGYYDLEDGGVFVNRRIVALPSELYLVDDEFYAGTPHRYQQYFHFNNAGDVTGEGNRFRYESARNRADVFLVGAYRETSLLPTRLSRCYNHAEDNLTLKTELEGRNFVSAFTVISLGAPDSAEKTTVEKVPVYSNFKGIQFEDRQIEAVNITKGRQRYTVVIAHEEYASPTDTFCADGCTGFGGVVVFDRSAGEDVIGHVLAW